MNNPMIEIAEKHIKMINRHKERYINAFCLRYGLSSIDDIENYYIKTWTEFASDNCEMVSCFKMENVSLIPEEIQRKTIKYILNDIKNSIKMIEDNLDNN